MRDIGGLLAKKKLRVKVKSTATSKILMHPLQFSLILAKLFHLL